MSSSPSLTVHHLRVSQSERILWLCEELSLPYVLHCYDRAPIFAPAAYKALHPAETAPVVQDTASNVTLAESGACMEYIAHVHAKGRLFLKPDHPDYAEFLYWWHWGNATLFPSCSRAMGMKEDDPMKGWVEERRERSLRGMEGRLEELAGKGEGQWWLAGREFTAADIMVVWSLTTMRHFAPFGLEKFPRILEYLERVGEREAYRRAMKKGDPEMKLLLGKEGPEKTFFEMRREEGKM